MRHAHGGQLRLALRCRWSSSRAHTTADMAMQTPLKASLCSLGLLLSLGVLVFEDAHATTPASE